MLPVSETFRQLMKSSVRPKCEPFIRVYGEDNNGNEISLEWKSSNITGLKYKRGVDILGRTLPYMELEWTEIFFGKMDENLSPEKYNNITKYMAVELSFVQDLGKHGTWDFFDPVKNPAYWNGLYESGTTWRSLFAGRFMGVDFSKAKSETVTFPTLFLDAMPTIKGNTITWTAKDVLYFLQSNQKKLFLPTANHSNKITDGKIISNLIADNRSVYRKSPQLFLALTKTIDSIMTQSVSYEVTENLACNGTTTDLVKNVAATFNKYFDFENDYAVLKSAIEDQQEFISSRTQSVFSGNVLFSYPTITSGTAVSAYEFHKKFTGLLANQTDPYIIDNGEKYTYGGISFDLYNFKDFGESVSAGIYCTDGVRALQYNGTGAFVVPYDVVDIEQSINLNKIGEPFIEDNPQNIYGAENQQERAKAVNQYFTNKATLEYSALANVALTPCDVVSVETNTFKDDKRISKKAVIVSIELEYNGGLREKFIAHEVE